MTTPATTSTNPTPPVPVKPVPGATTPAANAVSLATLKADAQTWAKTLVDELAAKVEGGLPNAQSALDAWISKL